MASFLVRAARCPLPVHTSRLLKCPASVKKIHVLQPTRRAGEDGDLFGVPDEPKSEILPPMATESPPNYSDSRDQKFHEFLQFVHDRTGRVKVVKAGQVRTTVWLRLFQLASKVEHLEAVAKVFPRWRESGKSFTPLDAEMFIRRCEELDCPLLALKVFGNHPKYGLALASVPTARTLLHSLYQKYPLENVIAAVALFGLNNLPPVTKDPASCAMLYAACLRSKNKHASLLGRDIRLALQTLLKDTTPFPEPKERTLRARHSVKPDLWLFEALRDIKKTKSDQGRGSWWISEWIAGGEGRILPPLAERRYQARGGKHARGESVTPVKRSARHLYA